jgi:hypothetical protein
MHEQKMNTHTHTHTNTHTHTHTHTHIHILTLCDKKGKNGVSSDQTPQVELTIGCQASTLIEDIEEKILLASVERN